MTRTYWQLCQRFFWHGMEAQVRDYITSCSCASLSITFDYKPGELHPIPVRGILHRLHVDLKGPLPVTTSGMKYIAVAVDSLSKWVEAEPLPDKSAVATAQFMLRVLARHSCPHEVVTDNGTEFMGDFSRLLQMHCIDHHHTSAYHPQANGLAERMMRSMMSSLEALCSSHPGDWDLHLPIFLWGYRTSRHATTLYSPFFLLYGREAVMPVDLEYGLAQDTGGTEEQKLLALTQTRTQSLLAAHETALEHITTSQMRAVEAHRSKRQRTAAPPGPSSNPAAASPIEGESPSPFRVGMYVHLFTPKGKEPLTGPHPIFKVAKLNKTHTNATLEDATGARFSVHTSRLARYDQRAGGDEASRC